MHNGIMAYGYIIADLGSIFLIGAMYDGAILDVYFIADADVINVAPNHGIEPDTAIIAYHYITYNRGSRRYKTIGAELRGFIQTGNNNSHNI